MHIKLLSAIIGLYVAVGAFGQPAPDAAVDPAALDAAYARLQARRDAATRDSADASTRPTTRPAKARSVVFVIDTTGSMITSIDDVHDEVSRAIRDLDPAQRFTIVAEGDNKVQRLGRALVNASDSNKAAAIDMLDNLLPHGSGDFKDGMKEALILRPDVVWIVSDGDVGGPKEEAPILAMARSFSGSVHVNTTLAMVSKASDGQAAVFLWELAHAGGGVCYGVDGAPVVDPPAGKPAPRATAAPATRPTPREIPAGPSIFKID
jgi:hypothetical protein